MQESWRSSFRPQQHPKPSAARGAFRRSHGSSRDVWEPHLVAGLRAGVRAGLGASSSDSPPALLPPGRRLPSDPSDAAGDRGAGDLSTLNGEPRSPIKASASTPVPCRGFPGEGWPCWAAAVCGSSCRPASLSLSTGPRTAAEATGAATAAAGSTTERLGSGCGWPASSESIIASSKPCGSCPDLCRHRHVPLLVSLGYAGLFLDDVTRQS